MSFAYVWGVCAAGLVLLELCLAAGVRLGWLPAGALADAGYLVCFVAGVGAGRLRKIPGRLAPALRAGGMAGTLVGAVAAVVGPLLLHAVGRVPVEWSLRSAPETVIRMLLAATVGAVMGTIGAVLGWAVRAALET